MKLIYSRGSNSVILSLYHLTFVLSYRRPTLVWHKLAIKQHLIKETNMNQHLHHIDLLKVTRTVVCTTQPQVPHVEMYSQSDTTRRLHRAAPLVRQSKGRPTRKVEVDMITCDHVIKVTWRKTLSCLPPRDRSRGGRRDHVNLHLTLIT